jgi:hypothetical protein
MTTFLAIIGFLFLPLLVGLFAFVFGFLCGAKEFGKAIKAANLSAEQKKIISDTLTKVNIKL